MIETIPKHKDAREPRNQKRQSEHSNYVRTVVLPRLEQLKAGPMSRAAIAPVRQNAVQAAASNMPSLNWQQHQPALAAQHSLPADYFVRNPTVDNAIAVGSQSVRPDDPDPFAASAAFSAAAAQPPAVPATASALSSPTFLPTCPPGSRAIQLNWTESFDMVNFRMSLFGRFGVISVQAVLSTCQIGCNPTARNTDLGFKALQASTPSLCGSRNRPSQWQGRSVRSTPESRLRPQWLAHSHPETFHYRHRYGH